MREASRILEKAVLAKASARQAATLNDTATAIHYCLRYLAEDARQHGLVQTVGLLELIADLALDEARAKRSRH
jgi:hypothetical protein